MKHGCKPTKKQSIFIEEHGLNPENWLIIKDTPTEMVLVHRHFNSQTSKIYKEEKT